MNNTKIFLLLFFVAFLSTGQLAAQHKMGDNPTSIDNGSLLELESTNKALLLPGMTTAQMNSMPPLLDGAKEYNTAKN